MLKVAFDDYLKHVGRNIKDCRQGNGLRQIDIQEKIGLEYKHYQRIEAGSVNVSLETLYRLSVVFNVEVEQLVKQRME